MSSKTGFHLKEKVISLYYGKTVDRRREKGSTRSSRPIGQRREDREAKPFNEFCGSKMNLWVHPHTQGTCAIADEKIAQPFVWKR